MNSIVVPKPHVHTSRFRNIDVKDIHSKELVILAGDATELRGHLPVWDAIEKGDPSRIATITQINKEKISVKKGNDSPSVIALRDDKSLEQLISTEMLLLDISGLPHHVWAPLLKAAYKNKVKTRILYAEPDSYKLHPSPASATLFDLSVRIHGLGPLPGFARLSGPEDEYKCLFVPMLGFEGNRPLRLSLQLDPTPKVIPVVGVPGFQLEFPAYTIACNRNLLEDYRAQAEIRYARASCPFEAYEAISNIRKDYPDHYLYLAPVGTKPHSLGAILYAIAHPSYTEIMFDHPDRKPGRTKGVGVIHIYDFGKFDGI